MSVNLMYSVVQIHIFCVDFLSGCLPRVVLMFPTTIALLSAFNRLSCCLGTGLEPWPTGLALVLEYMWAGLVSGTSVFGLKPGSVGPA